MAKGITSTSNPYVKHLVKLRSDASYRKKEQRVLIEGKHIVQEHAKLKTLIVNDEKLAEQLVADEVYLVDDTIIKKISGSQHPEGILAEVAMPIEAALTNCQVLLALHGVSDPGNLGTLFRTAFAFGWSGIFLLPNCCDPFNDKALRAAKGATFKIPYRIGTVSDLKKISQHLTPLCADLEGQSPELFQKQRVLLVIGNEASGISNPVKHFCKPVSLPMEGMESLNASIAGGILLYLLRP